MTKALIHEAMKENMRLFLIILLFLFVRHHQLTTDYFIPFLSVVVYEEWI